MLKDGVSNAYWLLQEKYHGRKSKDFLKDVVRLKKGEPIDYVIGWLPFLNCKIDLSFRPLVPRLETEYWVEKAIQTIPSINRLIKIADVFSGSGAIGIAVLKNIKNAHVDFFEIDKRAVKQIKKNLQINKVAKNRFRIFQADIFGDEKYKYDFILANPPYLAKDRIHKIQHKVLQYEPHVALFGGKDGLFFVDKFLLQAGTHSNKNGQIWMEFDSWQKKGIEKLLKRAGYKNWKFQKDQYNRWRFVIVNQIC